MLAAQGWDEKSPGGLGVRGNLGREPIIPKQVKNDTIGLGRKESRRKDGRDEVRTGKVGKVGKRGKDVRNEYERERQVRKELMEYMSR